MWVIVLILVNVIWNTVDARYLKLVHKEKDDSSREDQEFARLEKRQQITGELEIGGQRFESLGCWRDAWSRSLPTLEGEHYLLMDPNYKGRRHALFKCARAAFDKGYKLFGIENGGQCFASAGGDKRYHKYGASKDCKGDGKGGPWSLQVYRFLDSHHAVNGAYSHWSSWGACSRSCAGGVRRRMRKCSNPPPSNGGQDCSGLGHSVESQDCNVKSCTDDYEFEDPEITGSSPTSTKRDESQIQPPAVLRQSGPPFQPITEQNDGKHPEYHTSTQGWRQAVFQKQDTYLTNNDDHSHNEEVKYSPMSPTTHIQDMSQAFSQKQQSVQTNVHPSNREEGKYAFTPNEQDADPPVNRKEHPSPENSGNQSNVKEGGEYFPLSKQDVKDFRHVASFQTSKSPSSSRQDSESAKGVSNHMDTYDNSLKQPVVNPELLKESKGQGNGLSDKYVPLGNKFTQSMQPTASAEPLKNVKTVWNEVSKPPFLESERFKHENSIHNSSSVKQGTHTSQGSEIYLGAQPPPPLNTNGHSNYENTKGGNYIPEKNEGVTFSHSNGRIEAGTMKLIPSDRIHGKMDSVDNRQDQSGFSSVGESLRVAKPGYPSKMPSDVASEEQDTLQQQSNNFPSRLSNNQGIEIRIRPVGDYLPKQFRAFQRIENNSEDMVSAEHKPAEMPKQNFQYFDHDQPKVRNKSEETSSSTLKIHAKNRDNEQESSHEQQRWQNAKGIPTTVAESLKDKSENGERGKSSNPQHEKLSASMSNPDTTSQLQGSPQQKQPSNEKQDFEQKTGEQSETSNQLQGPPSHHGEKVHDSNHFTSKGNALSVNKEKPADSHSPINEQTHPKKEADSTSPAKVHQAQQVSESSKANPSGEETKVQQTSGVKNQHQETDQGQNAQEEGEPVPVVDLNNGNTEDGTDYGTATNQVFSGPVEDTGMQNQPEPDSQGAGQSSGPGYDNEAIQGISEMSQREDQSILQQANSASQGGPDQGIGTGYEEMSDSNAYTGEIPREKNKQDAEDEANMRGRYLDRFQDQASLTSDYYNTEPAGDCLCPKKECSAKADIAFLVDGSANIPQPYYARVLEFIKILSRGFDKSNIHVGMMSYGDDVKIALNLKALNDFQQFDNAVNIASYMGGEAHTGNALSKLKTRLFAISGRQDAPRALVLLSSGGSVDDVVAPGLELRDSGVKVTAIGLGKQANVRELITVASEPKSEHVFTAFLDTLPNAMDEIIQGICRDVMGIVRDRQEPCTCETYNGQVFPSSDYTKETPTNIPESTSLQEQDSSYSQGRVEGARVPFDQSERLSQQSPADYPYGNGASPARGEEPTSPEGDGRLSYGQHGDQSNDASERPTDLQTDYSNEQGSANHVAGNLGNQDNYSGQVIGGQLERPYQQQQTRLPGEQYRVADEKENREDEGKTTGEVDYSANSGYKNGGRDNHLRYEGEKGLMHSSQSHRFTAALPEHYKPHVGNDGRGGENSSNQGSSGQQESEQSSEAQGKDDKEANLFPSISTLNHERVQGTASHVHAYFIPHSGNGTLRRPSAQPKYLQSSAKAADEFLSGYRLPTKVIAVDKVAENDNAGLQQKYHHACSGINLGVVLDSTASPGGRGNQQAANMLDLAKRVSHLFPMSPQGNSVGMVVYGGSPKPSVVHFDKFLDQKSMDEAIDNASKPNLEIRIGKALSLAQKHLFRYLSMSKRNVLLLVTDRASFDDVRRPAVELKRRGIEIFCLGVGQDVNREQLDLIASEPKENHVFLAPFNDSETLMERIGKEICLAANKSRKEDNIPKRRGRLSHNLAEM